MKPPTLFRCADWGARPPKQPIVQAGKPSRIIFHHTAGHAPNLAPGDTIEEAKAYARTIQNYHMDGQGWNDSGHNFLVTRGGFILEGRHGSVDAVAAGRMVVSAHCPGQNDQPGVEHEHVDEAAMTDAQFRASVRLHTWVCRSTGISPAAIYPHRRFFATSCPGALESELVRLRKAVAANLDVHPDLPTVRAKILQWRAAGKTWGWIKTTWVWRRFKQLGGK